MNDNTTPRAKLSRRRALRMLGLTAAVGYAAPMAMLVSSPKAEAWERSRRFRTRRFRTDRTDRFHHHHRHHHHHRTDRRWW